MSKAGRTLRRRWHRRRSTAQNRMLDLTILKSKRARCHPRQHSTVAELCRLASRSVRNSNSLSRYSIRCHPPRNLKCGAHIGTRLTVRPVWHIHVHARTHACMHRHTQDAAKHNNESYYLRCIGMLAPGVNIHKIVYWPIIKLWRGYGFSLTRIWFLLVVWLSSITKRFTLADSLRVPWLKTMCGVLTQWLAVPHLYRRLRFRVSLAQAECGRQLRWTALRVNVHAHI